MHACAFDFMAMVSVARREPRAPRVFVDLASVPPSQWSMHDRLENWARWCRGTGRQSGKAGSPIFGMSVSSNVRRPHGEDTTVPIDQRDATRLQVGVAALPDKHRRAIQWHYLHPRDPIGQARELAVPLDGLRDLVRDGRQMLINRGV